MDRNVIVRTPESKMMSSLILYDDFTYDMLSSTGEVILTHKWKYYKREIVLMIGFDKMMTKWTGGMDVPQPLSDLVPGLKDLIEWETVEKWIFEE